eukprot:Pgem_evm1s17687
MSDQYCRKRQKTDEEEIEKLKESDDDLSKPHCHSTPPEDAECMATFDDIDETNYCEYLTQPKSVGE